MGKTSLDNRTKMTYKEKTNGTSIWISNHIRRPRGYKPPKGKSSDRSSDMSQSPSRASTTSSSRGMQPPGPTSAAG